MNSLPEWINLGYDDEIGCTRFIPKDSVSEIRVKIDEEGDSLYEIYGKDRKLIKSIDFVPWKEEGYKNLLVANNGWVFIIINFDEYGDFKIIEEPVIAWEIDSTLPRVITLNGRRFLGNWDSSYDKNIYAIRDPNQKWHIHDTDKMVTLDASSDIKEKARDISRVVSP